MPDHNVTTASLRSNRVVTFPGTSGNFPADQLVSFAEIASTSRPTRPAHS